MWTVDIFLNTGKISIYRNICFIVDVAIVIFQIKGRKKKNVHLSDEVPASKNKHEKYRNCTLVTLRKKFFEYADINKINVSAAKLPILGLILMQIDS